MPSKGVQIVIDTLIKERHKIAPDANLFKLGIACHATELAHKKYVELTNKIIALGGTPPPDVFQYQEQNK